MQSKPQTRLLLLLAAVLFQWAGLAAQGFQKLYPVSGKQSFGSVLLGSPDGGFLMVGHNQSPADPNLKEPRVAKIDQDGAIQWETTFPGLPGAKSVASGGLSLADGSFLVAGKTAGFDSIFLAKMDGAGQVAWLQKYDDPANTATLPYNNQVRIEPIGDGSFYLVWADYNGEISASRVDPAGNQLWAHFFGQPNIAPVRRFCTKLGQGEQLYATGRSDAEGAIFNNLIIDKNGGLVTTSTLPTDVGNVDCPASGWLADGNFVVGAWNFALNKNQFLVEKRTSGGNPIWSKVVWEGDFAGWGWDGRVAEAPNGDILVSFNYLPDAFPDNYAVPVVRLSADGQLKWAKQFNPEQENINYFTYGMVGTADGGMAGLNSRLSDLDNPDSHAMFFVKTDSTGRSHLATIWGRIMKDFDGNCADSPIEVGMKNLPIIATNTAGDHFYATSDSTGHYNMEVDTGSYLVAVQPPSNLWLPCQNDVPASLTVANDSAVVDFPIQPTAVCPQLEVTMSANRMRPCFNTIWTLNYCNTGTETSSDGFIIVSLVSLLTAVSASVPMTILPNNQVRLDIPDLESLECGSATLTILTSCDAVLGQMLCVEAHIFPDTVCGSTASNQPVLKATGKCVGNDVVKFTIENIGTEDMALPSNYIVIEEDMIQLSDQGQIPLLNVGQTHDILVAAIGSTFRIEVEPAVGGPVWSSPSAVVEGCGNNPTFGFGTMFEPDDDAPFIDIACLEVVNSFDPNDKLAYPKGARAEHFLEKNTDIEYTINFQNTGNDTAYLVTIRDTLDAALDPASVRMGASSHPYSWQLLGQGVLKITFADINLVDSNHNEAASHGFVQFRIAQKKDLADGTLIQNSGAIYFDNNAPVITNTVFHNIGKPFVVATFDQPEAVQNCSVVPNPFVDLAEITLKNAPVGPKNFTLMDAHGKVLQQENFDENRFSIHAGQLPVGAYFFQIKNREGYFVSGKLVKQ